MLGVQILSLIGELRSQMPRGATTKSIHLYMLSHIRLFATPWTVVHQAPLSMQFFKQEYWRGFPFPPSGGLPDSRIKPMSLVSPALTGGFFTTEHLGGYI